MEIRLLITVGFSQDIFLIDAYRVKSLGSYVLCIQEHSQDLSPYHALIWLW